VIDSHSKEESEKSNMTDKEVKRIAQGLISDFKIESPTMVDFCNSIIQKFEQPNILDKIKTEIEQAAINDVNGSKYIFVNRVNQIIDKYGRKEE